MIETVGFTGSQDGMTNDQTCVVHMLLGEFKEIGAKQARHGMCIGADADFHAMAMAFKYRMIGHPGVNKQGKVWKRAHVVCQDVVPERFFIDRNHDIADRSEVVIATPKEFDEVMIGSGTWATIRYCRKPSVAKPLVIVFPDGSLKVENVVGYLPTLDRTALVQLIAKQGKEYANYLANPLDPRD